MVMPGDDMVDSRALETQPKFSAQGTQVESLLVALKNFSNGYGSFIGKQLFFDVSKGRVQHTAQE